MTTTDMVVLAIIIAYAVAGIIFTVFTTRDLLADPSTDDFGTPMRHRWDIVIGAFVFGPVFWLLVSIMDAITWCWVKIVGR